MTLSYYKKNQDSPLKACIEFIESYKKGYTMGDAPYLSGPEHVTSKISEDRIFQIPKGSEPRTLGFVDGGNAPIINSADFNISLNRVAGAIFQGSDYRELKNIPEMVEFYTATIVNPKENGKLEFITKFFSREEDNQKYLPIDNLVFEISDPSIIRDGRFLINIERFGGIARRFAEWTYGKAFIEHELNSGEIFVRDGSLQTGYTGEIKLAEDLYQVAMKKKVYVTGLSKTCRLFTNNGDSLITVIDIIATSKYPEEAWYYHPIYKFTRVDNQADLYFVKLHEHSSYPFRFDIYINQSDALGQSGREVILSSLAENSQDLAFPGYPYGLVKVDQLSRVSYTELDSHKIMLLSEFDEEHYEKFIRPRLRSVDAHDLLNKIRF
ncbi:MAG: hypothetical protein ACXADY_13970 [Candidatus Hodarchaeales archaeon]